YFFKAASLSVSNSLASCSEVRVKSAFADVASLPGDDSLPGPLEVCVPAGVSEPLLDPSASAALARRGRAGTNRLPNRWLMEKLLVKTSGPAEPRRPRNHVARGHSAVVCC